MRGAYYVAIALLIAASSRAAADSDRVEPHQALDDDYMASGGTDNKMLPRRVLRESPDPKDKLTVHASDEERMVSRFSNSNSIAKGLERTIIKAANVLRTDGEDVIADAAKPIKIFNRLKPMLAMQNSKRQRIGSTLNKVDGHELHTSPNPKNSLVSSASAKRLGKDEPRRTVNTAKRSVKKTQHDYRFAPSGFPSTSTAALDGRRNKQLIARKAFDLDTSKHPEDVKVENSKRQRMDPKPDSVGGRDLHTTPKSKQSLVSFASAKRLGRDEPRVTVNTAKRPVKKMQHDYRSTPSGSTPTNAVAPDGRLNKQPIARKEVKVDKNKQPDKAKINLKKRERIDSEPDIEALTKLSKSSVSFALAKRLKKDEPRVNVNSGVRPVKKTQHHYQSAPSGSSPTSADVSGGRLEKQLNAQKAIDLDKNKRPDEVKIRNKNQQVIDPTPKNENGQALRAPPTPGESLVSVANNALFASAERDEPKVTVDTATRPVKKTQHDYRSAPSSSSPTSAAVPDGRLNKQLILRKGFKVDKNKHPNKVKIKIKKRERIDPRPDIVGGQEVHTTPNPRKHLVSVAEDAPVVLAKRVDPNVPTFIIDNAVETLKTHNFLSAPPDSFPTSAAAPDGRLNTQLIGRKPFEIDLNKLPDDVEVRDSQRQSIDPKNNNVVGQAQAFKFDLNKHPDEVESHSVDHPPHLREKNEKFAHSATAIGQSVSINWKSELRSGPHVGKKDRSTVKARKVHVAFLQAYSLPFHQYPAETSKMLRLVNWNKFRASPNNILVWRSLRNLATSQNAERLKMLLRPDLVKLVGEEMAALKIDKKILKDAYTVKLVIMYELFYDFCHGNRDLVGDLPKKGIRQDSILELST